MVFLACSAANLSSYFAKRADKVHNEKPWADNEVYRDNEAANTFYFIAASTWSLLHWVFASKYFELALKLRIIVKALSSQ